MKELGRKFVGTWNTFTLVSVAVGAALFGVLMVYASIPVFTNTNLTAAMIVPVVVGGLFGPLPAFITMGVGNMIADMLFGGFWPAWSVANAVLGLFIGALPLYGADIRKGKFTIIHAAIYAVLVVVGNAIAFGFVAPFITQYILGIDAELSLLQAIPASIANIAVQIIVGIPLLFLLSRRFASRTNLQEED